MYSKFSRKETEKVGSGAFEKAKYTSRRQVLSTD